MQRNPSHSKFFLTIGDWSAKVWSEDGKSPIMNTRYAPSYLTAGCWSPTRAGVFFATRMDGVVDVWDYYHRQNAVAYSHKVSYCAWLLACCELPIVCELMLGYVCSACCATARLGTTRCRPSQCRATCSLVAVWWRWAT